MKKKLIPLFSMFLLISNLCICISANGADDYDFRKTRWGMSKEEVKASEHRDVYDVYREETSEGIEVLIYEDNLLGNECLLGYIFADDQLTRTKYIFTHDHSNHMGFIYDYEDLKEALTKKYGIPTKDKTFWNGEEDSDNSHPRDGHDLFMGRLSYGSSWKTETTGIWLYLTGQDYDIQLILEYFSKNLSYLEEDFLQEKL